ncbi:MAG: heavy-metal-associated domain-containing protein, partial [Candidatus Eiseniibacteriota bacterium]
SNRRWLRTNRVMMRISTELVVAFASFPSYVGGLVGAGGASAVPGEDAEQLVLGVEGMTCSGCEAAVEMALSAVPGVLAAGAGYEAGTAALRVESTRIPSRTALAAAVTSAGYKLASAGGGDEATPAAGKTATPAAGEPSIRGQWETDLPTGEGKVSRMVVDLGTLGSRWVGEFDLMEFQVEDYPVEVSEAGETIRLHFTAIETDFEGRLGEDGSRIGGTATIGDEQVPLELRRVTAEPQFSKDFLALETAAGEPSLVTELSSDARPLRDRFNADRDKTRLLMLLSPT